MSDFVLNKLEELTRRVDQLEKHDHGPGYHEHLLDGEEFEHHHSKAHKSRAKHPLGQRRQGERRTGERRVSTEKYEGEERRA